MDCVPRSCVRGQDSLLDLRAVGTLLDAELEGMVCRGACRSVLRRYVAASWTLMQGSGRRSLLEKPSLVCPCGNKQWMNARGAEPIYTTATPMGRGSIYLRGESVSRTGSRSACVGGGVEKRTSTGARVLPLVATETRDGGDNGWTLDDKIIRILSVKAKAKAKGKNRLKRTHLVDSK